MANETLSPNQAKAIRNSYEQIMNTTKTKISKAYNDFFETMSQNWEDENAKTLADQIETALNEVDDTLKQNNDTFIDTLGNIAKAYCTVANMPITAIDRIVTAAIKADSKGKIKNTFDGDKFGFLNVGSAEAVTEALKTLQSTLSSVTSETVSNLQSINAFGNEGVQQGLASSAGKIVDILNDAVQQVEKSATSAIGKAAEAYTKTGSSASDASKISASS